MLKEVDGASVGGGRPTVDCWWTGGRVDLGPLSAFFRILLSINQDSTVAASTIAEGGWSGLAPAPGPTQHSSPDRSSQTAQCELINLPSVVPP